MGEFHINLKKGKVEKIDADVYFESVAPKNGIFKMYWQKGGAFHHPPVFTNEGHGVRYQWAYKDGKRADGFSRSYHYNPFKWLGEGTPPDNNGQPRFLANWKDGKRVGLQTWYHQNGLPYLTVLGTGKEARVVDVWTDKGELTCNNGTGYVEKFAPLTIVQPSELGGDGVKSFRHMDIIDFKLIKNLLSRVEFVSLFEVDGMQVFDGGGFKQCYQYKNYKRNLTDLFEDVSMENLTLNDMVTILPFNFEEDRYERLNGNVVLDYQTNSEFSQYYDLFELPKRMKLYRCEWEDGVKHGTETWWADRDVPYKDGFKESLEVKKIIWDKGKLVEEITNEKFWNDHLLGYKVF